MAGGRWDGLIVRFLYPFHLLVTEDKPPKFYCFGGAELCYFGRKSLFSITAQLEDRPAPPGVEMAGSWAINLYRASNLQTAHAFYLHLYRLLCDLFLFVIGADSETILSSFWLTCAKVPSRATLLACISCMPFSVDIFWCRLCAVRRLLYDELREPTWFVPGIALTVGGF